MLPINIADSFFIISSSIFLSVPVDWRELLIKMANEKIGALFFPKYPAIVDILLILPVFAHTEIELLFNLSVNVPWPSCGSKEMKCVCNGVA